MGRYVWFLLSNLLYVAVRIHRLLTLPEFTSSYNFGLKSAARSCQTRTLQSACCLSHWHWVVSGRVRWPSWVDRRVGTTFSVGETNCIVRFLHTATMLGLESTFFFSISLALPLCLSPTKSTHGFRSFTLDQCGSHVALSFALFAHAHD